MFPNPPTPSLLSWQALGFDDVPSEFSAMDCFDKLAVIQGAWSELGLLLQCLKDVPATASASAGAGGEGGPATSGVGAPPTVPPGPPSALLSTPRTGRHMGTPASAALSPSWTASGGAGAVCSNLSTPALQPFAWHDGRDADAFLSSPRLGELLHNHDHDHDRREPPIGPPLGAHASARQLHNQVHKQALVDWGGGARVPVSSSASVGSGAKDGEVKVKERKTSGAGVKASDRVALAAANGGSHGAASGGSSPGVPAGAGVGVGGEGAAGVSEAHTPGRRREADVVRAFSVGECHCEGLLFLDVAQIYPCCDFSAQPSLASAVAVFVCGQLHPPPRPRPCLRAVRRTWRVCGTPSHASPPPCTCCGSDTWQRPTGHKSQVLYCRMVPRDLSPHTHTHFMLPLASRTKEYGFGAGLVVC